MLLVAEVFLNVNCAMEYSINHTDAVLRHDREKLQIKYLNTNITEYSIPESSYKMLRSKRIIPH